MRFTRFTGRNIAFGVFIAFAAPAADCSIIYLQNGPSLEELYKSAKEKAAKSKVEASGPVNALMALLDLSYKQAPEQVESAINEILKYKGAATRALIGGLSAPASTPRGSNCARALAKSTDPTLVTEIEASLPTAPPEAKARIAWVLGRHPGDKTIVMLQKLLADPESAIYSEAALSLGNLKHKESAAAIAEKLEHAPHSAAAVSLLTALADMEEAKITPSIINFMELPMAVDCLGALSNAIRALHTKELLAPALKLMMKWKATNEDNLKLIMAVAPIVTPADRDALGLLKKLLTEVSASREVQEEAAYALHFAKDPNAKNFLLQDVNDRLKENPDNDKALRRRGKIYLKLKMYREAQRDYDDIKRLAKNKSTNIDGDLWVEMARANAGNKALPSAADCLRNALSGGTRSKAFRDYEEFAEMKKQAKYVPLFENND